jgi:hypothetical protein
VSALGPEADIDEIRRDVRFAPGRDIEGGFDIVREMFLPGELEQQHLEERGCSGQAVRGLID